MADEPPIIVIGAGRSGTNLLRDIICSFEGFGTWPCDEINYIWRHGNRRAPTDELQPADARPEVKRFIKRAFAKQARRQGGGAVVEKTCANSLRVGFVHEIFPDARFVYIVRDGRDVVASAMKRWTAPLDLPYLARKIRFVPPTDLPFYASRYFGARLNRVRSAERRLGSWGPRFAGMSDLVTDRPLAEVCARQWRSCVDAVDEQLDPAISPDQFLPVRYEDLVHQTTHEVDRLGHFFGLPAPPRNLLPTIRPPTTGQWRETLSAADQALITRVLDRSLSLRGYRQ